jgi:hypothetical protein
MGYLNVRDIEALISELGINKIYLDADGVIIQSVKAMVKLIKDKYGIDLEPCEVINWNFHDDLSSKQVEDLFSDESFFDIVELYDGLFDFIKRHTDKITIITKGNSRNLELKGLLFEEYGFNEVKYIGLPLNKSKGCVDMSGALFIDDCVTNLNESNADIKILFREFNNNADWQRGWSGLEMRSWL